MTLDEILQDIHALGEDLRIYERKYGVLSATFYESYVAGEEPADDAWVLDWSGWAGTYQIWLRRHEQYNKLMETLKMDTSLATLIQHTANREPLSIAI